MASSQNVTCAQCPGLRTPSLHSECCLYRTETEDTDTIRGKRHRSNYSHEDVHAALISAPDPPSEDELPRYLTVQSQEPGALAEDGGEGLSLEMSALSEPGSVELPGHGNATIDSLIAKTLPIYQAAHDPCGVEPQYSVLEEHWDVVDVTKLCMQDLLRPFQHNLNQCLNDNEEDIYDQSKEMELPLVVTDDLPASEADQVGGDSTADGNSLPEMSVPSEVAGSYASQSYDQQSDDMFGSGGMGIAGFQMRFPGDTSVMSGTTQDSGTIDILPKDDYYLVRFRPDTGKYVAEVRVREWNAVNQKIWVGTFVSEEEAGRAVDLVRKHLRCNKSAPYNFEDSRGSSSQTIPPHGFLLSDVSPENIKKVKAYFRDLVDSARRSGALTATPK